MASDLENLAVYLLLGLPLPGVEAAVFDSGIKSSHPSSVDQKLIKAVPDTTLKTYSDDYTFEQLHTIPADQLEAAVNDLLADRFEIRTNLFFLLIGDELEHTLPLSV